MFSAGDPTPVTRRITLHRNKPFEIRAIYPDPPAGTAPLLARFTVGGFPSSIDTAAPAPKVRVDFTHDIHGILRIAHAVVLQRKPDEPVPAPAPSPQAAQDGPADQQPAAAAAAGDAKDTTEDKPETGAANDAPDASAKPDDNAAANGEQDAAKADEAGKPEASADADQAKQDAPADAPAPAAAPTAAPAKKKRFRKVPLAISQPVCPGSLGETGLRTAYEAELAMQRADAVIRQTHARRNEIEEYVYGTRERIEGELAGFATEEEAENLKAELAEAEDWVCYGDGYEADLDTLTARLTALRALGDPIAKRAWEAEHRGPAAARLLESVERFKSIAGSAEERYDHLSQEDRDRLRSATRTAEHWLRELQDTQSAMAPVQDPVLLTADIETKIRWLDGECSPVANKPKPPPPAPAPEPAPAAATSDDQAKDKDQAAEQDKPADNEAGAGKDGEAKTDDGETQTDGDKPAAAGEEQEATSQDASSSSSSSEADQTDA